MDSFAKLSAEFFSAASECYEIPDPAKNPFLDPRKNFMKHDFVTFRNISDIS